MDAFKNIGGFFVAIWGGLLSLVPSAPRLLLYISIVLGIMNIIHVAPKTWRVISKLIGRKA